MPTKRTIPRVCQSCGKDFFAYPESVKRGEGKYCSRACSYQKGGNEEKFWRRVDKTPGQGPKGECWIWTGGRNAKGYGTFSLAPGVSVKAHRFAWELANGPIPEGMCVLHECDNPPCVRCLFLGTRTDNAEDMTSKGRRYSKLKREEVSEIKRRLAAGEGKQALANEYNVSYLTIWSIDNGERWADVG